jgi:hypothetical protein
MSYYSEVEYIPNEQEESLRSNYPDPSTLDEQRIVDLTVENQLLQDQHNADVIFITDIETALGIRAPYKGNRQFLLARLTSLVTECRKLTGIAA